MQLQVPTGVWLESGAVTQLLREMAPQLSLMAAGIPQVASFFVSFAGIPQAAAFFVSLPLSPLSRPLRSRSAQCPSSSLSHFSILSAMKIP